MDPIIAPEYLLKTFAILTIIGQVLIVLWIFGIILKRIQKRENWITTRMASKGILMAFIVALLATIGSLAISELGLLTPCKLCWFQRILMYPQVITVGLALWTKKDREGLIKAGIILSVIGALIALYHYLQQFGLAPINLPCSTVGYSVSCSNRFEATYGYVTIPLMSLTAFMMIWISLALAKKSR